MKIGDMYKTNTHTNTFISDSVIEITKINKTTIAYKYIKTSEYVSEDANYFAQKVESFKMDAVPLTDLTRALL